jgi:hypothetical protein
MEQDISSFRTGVYVSGEMEFDQPWARGAVEGRAEAYREWAKGEEGYGLKIQASAGAELGGKDSGYNAAASLSGEVQIHDNGDFKKLTLSGQMSGTAANEKLGLNLPPGSSTGQGVDVELTVDEDNPALADIKSAMADGDLGRAKDLALDNGELVVRQTTIAEIASEEYEIDLKVAEAEVKYGASAETANHIWYREAGNSTVVSVDPSKLPVNN